LSLNILIFNNLDYGSCNMGINPSQNCCYGLILAAGRGGPLETSIVIFSLPFPNLKHLFMAVPPTIDMLNIIEVEAPWTTQSRKDMTE
jgi:hypothetical protein